MMEHVCDERCVCPRGHGPLYYSKAHKAHACREPGCPIEGERRRRLLVESHLPGCPARIQLDDICRCRHLRGEVPKPAPPENEEEAEPWIRLGG